eukprot:1157305-Pelagomonas_calceolata.AAC.20
MQNRCSKSRPRKGEAWQNISGQAHRSVQCAERSLAHPSCVHDAEAHAKAPGLEHGITGNMFQAKHTNVPLIDGAWRTPLCMHTDKAHAGVNPMLLTRNFTNTAPPHYLAQCCNVGHVGALRGGKGIVAAGGPFPAPLCKCNVHKERALFYLSTETITWICDGVGELRQAPLEHRAHNGAAYIASAASLRAVVGGGGAPAGAGAAFLVLGCSSSAAITTASAAAIGMSSSA